MQKKRLIILAGPLDNQNAGVHRVTFEIVKGLHELDDCPFEITLIRDKNDNQFSKFKTAVIPTFKKIPGFQSFRLFFIVPLYCILNRADIVFEPAHFGPFNLLPWIKRVTFIHDLTPIKLPEFHTFNGSVLQKLFLPRILRKTDLVICNSENTKSDLLDIYPFTKGKIKRIYLGISAFFIKVNSKEIINNLKLKSPYFLSVNTIEPRKNLDTLLIAFEKYKNVNKTDHSLVLVGGKGWKNEGIYKAINNHKYKNDIKLTGFVTNEALRELYSHCHAFVYPSIYEGFGLPVLEAALCGAPVIVANNSSLKEIAPHQNLLFETKDSDDLAEKMQTIGNEDFIQDVPKLISTYNWTNFTKIFTESLKQMFP